MASERVSSDRDGTKTEFVGFPAELPEADRDRWTEMTASQRAKASARLAAFTAWRDGSMDIDEAIKKSGLSRSRFYRLAADWRASPSLAALGAFTGSGAPRGRLDPKAVNALQSVVAKVVALNEGASVSQLVRIMVDQAGVETKALPGAARLRQIVEDEQRRVSATGEAGHIVLFDCTAINLPRDNGRPFIMFAVIDKGTGLVLGTAVGPEPDVAVGYARAAREALRRDAEHPGLPWALRTSQLFMVAGADVEASAALRQRMLEAGVRANVLLSSVPRRYGRYLRTAVGDRVGRIAITPGRTEEGEALPDNRDMRPWSEIEASAAVSLAFDQRNATLIGDLVKPVGGRMPDDLAKALRFLSSYAE